MGEMYRTSKGWDWKRGYVLGYTRFLYFSYIGAHVGAGLGGGKRKEGCSPLSITSISRGSKVVE